MDTDGDALAYSLGGADASNFTVAASSGLLRTASALDFETESSYTVTVSVSDGKNTDGGPDTAVDATITVEIGVNDAEEAGAVALSTAHPRVGTAVNATPHRPRRRRDRHCLELGTLNRQDRLDSYNRRRLGRLHPHHGRCWLLPAGHGLLHRRPGIRQNRPSDHNQRSAPARSGPHHHHNNSGPRLRNNTHPRRRPTCSRTWQKQESTKPP